MSFESKNWRGARRNDRGRGYRRNDPDKPRVRPPPHLRGREIGLFYRDIQRRTPKALPKLELPEHVKNKLLDALNSLNDQDFSVDETSENFSNTFTKDYLDIINVSFLEKLNNAFQNNARHTVDEYNEKLHEEHLSKQDDPKYREMLKFRQKLPTYEKRNEILKCINENQVIVINGETGCGKTTQVGQLILEEACSNHRGASINILITQPRRIAAISVANRIAEERGENLGKSVGFTIRLDRVSTRKCGSIEVITSGILLQRLQSDPALLEVSHLILDEVHERDIICDITLSVVKQIIAKRKDLKIILMSATMDSERFSQYFNGCPQLHIPGQMFPVKEFFLEDVLQATGFCDFSQQKYTNEYMSYKRRHEVERFKKEQMNQEFRRMIKPFVEKLKLTGAYSDEVLELLKNPQSEDTCYELVVSLVQYLSRQSPGAILVFMPGIMDISKVCQLLEKASSRMPPHIVYPLHSRLNTPEQRAVFQTPPEGVRKIIISTNIAETSITIDDVVYVIDSGKSKLSGYNADQDLSTLKSEWISNSNAQQRRGRAGRVQAGECWRLYTSARFQQFSPRPVAEILRAPLNEPILSVLLLRLGPAQKFFETLLDPPNLESVTSAIRLLSRMGILDEKDCLTPLGVHIARLPVAPGAARMLLLAALLSAIGPVTAIAASIAFRDPFYTPIGKEREVDKRKLILSKGHGSDQITVAEAQMKWEELTSFGRYARDFCHENFLSWRTLEMLKDMRRQFSSLLYNAQFLSSSDPDVQESNKNSQNYSLIKALIVAGLYPNVAKYKSKKILSNEEHNHLEIHPSSVNYNKLPPAERLVYFLKQQSTKIYLHDTSPAHAIPMLFFGDRYKILPNPSDDKFVRVEIGGGSWITSPSTARLLGRLRHELDLLLQNKLHNPGPVNWNSSEGKVLTAIIDLITAEDDPSIEVDSDE